MLKASRVPLSRGDVIRTMTGGGGGYGSPTERDPNAVRRDIRAGHVTADVARTVYGLNAEEQQQ
jgi:N-methylhydantoinase B